MTMAVEFQNLRARVDLLEKTVLSITEDKKNDDN